MARAIKQGQHIFIAFQDGEAVLDSQLRPRMYKSREQFEKSFPAWRDGKAELVEYAPTLTPPNEWVSVNKRLPEKRKDVLVHYGNGRIGIDYQSRNCLTAARRRKRHEYIPTDQLISERSAGRRGYPPVAWV